VTIRRGRLGYLGALGWAAVAAVTGLAVAGCSSAAAPAAPGTGGYHGLTIGQAEAGYGSYLSTSEAAAAQGQSLQGLSVVGDAQWAVVHSQYAALASAGTPVPQYHYGQPVFYVPALTSDPQWFVVVVPVSTEVGGNPAAAVKEVMVFERSVPGQVFTLIGTAALDQPLPAIARDSHGYAIAVTTTDPSVLLSPDAVGATQAAVVDEGPANPAATVLASGPQTTGLYTAQAADGQAAAAKHLQYIWLLGGTTFPQFQLRTADGGALVFYGMYLNTTTQYPNGLAGSPIPVPVLFRPLLGPDPATGDHGVAANWTYEYVAADPPLTAHHAKVEIIAATGAPTYAHAW
jgi:hypothetical protein